MNAFLFGFLNELLFIMQDNNVIIYNILYNKISDRAILSEVTAVDNKNIILAGEIKSATYHNLKMGLLQKYRENF